MPHFSDSIIIQSERLVRELFFRRVQLDRVVLCGVVVANPAQLEVVANEVFVK
jgi:hypothetical protein